MKSVFLSLILLGLISVSAVAADIQSGYTVKLATRTETIPARVMLCPSTDGSNTAVACSFGGGGGGTVIQGSGGSPTSPWYVAPGTGSVWASNIAQFGGTTVNIGQTTMAASMPVAIASDQSAISSIPTPPATTSLTNGLTQSSTSVAASSLVVKASAGILYRVLVSNPTAAGYLMIFNATTAPADGAVTPSLCLPVASASYANDTLDPIGDYYSTGIVAVFSTTGCFTKTTTAGTAFIHASYK